MNFMRRIFSQGLPRVESLLIRPLSVVSPSEQKLIDLLKGRFPKAETVQVNDISGGCGAMFEVTVISEEFAGMNRVKQHMLINKTLQSEIKDMHGIRIITSLPDK